MIVHDDPADIVFPNGFESALLGKTVLVGVTYYDQSGTVLRRRQFCGEVVGLSPRSGVTLLNRRLGVEFVVPPVPDNFVVADPGIYTLKESAEVVTNPDYVCTWDVVET